VCTQAARKNLTLTLTLTHTITAYSVSGNVVRLRHACAHTHVQLDKSRIEKKEFGPLKSHSKDFWVSK